MTIPTLRKTLSICLLLSVTYLSFILIACSSNNDQTGAALIFQKADKLREARHFSQAIPYLEKLLAEQRAAKPCNKAVLSKTLDYLGELNYLAGNYADAEPLLTESLSIRKELYGTDQIEKAESYEHLGVLFVLEGKYRNGYELINNAIAIKENIYGPDSPNVFFSLKRLANNYYGLKRYDRAKGFFVRFLQLRNVAIGSNYQNYPAISRGTSLASRSNGQPANNLTSVENIRRPSKVEAIHNSQDAIKYHKAINDRRIGNSYYFQGKYDKAEQYFQSVLDYCDANSDVSPALCCNAMNDMGALRSSIVASNDGISYFKSALSLAKRHFPPDHLIIANTLLNIGHYYSSIADYTNALVYYERALKIFENKFSPNNPRALQIYLALGRLYLMEDNTDKASYFTHKAMVGIEKTLGTNNKLYAWCLFNLGFLSHRNKEYHKAEKFYNQAINIWRDELGPTYIPQAITLNFLSHLYAENGDISKAVSSLLKCHQIEDKAIDQITDFTSENQQLSIAEGDMITLQLYLNLIGKYYKKDQQKIQEALDIWLKGKGRILDVQARLHESSLKDNNPESERLFQELNKVRDKLSRMAFSQPAPVDRVAYKKLKDELEVKKNRIEAQLSRISKPFATKQRIAKANSEQIAKVLPTGAVLLEFARTQALVNNSNGRLVHSYIAFILHGGEGHDVDMVDLGDADQIDGLIAKYKRALSESSGGYGGTALANSKELYDLVFHPLLKYIGTSKKIFISPDGNLNLIPFEVLQKPDGKFLIEEYTFNYLAAGRDLLGFADDSILSNKCLLMGAPDFDLKLLDNQAPGNAPADEKASVTKRSADIGEISFGPLRYAKAELEAIGKVLGAGRSEIFTGKDASEETLMNASGPEILHLATHGFFLSDQESSGNGRGFQIADLHAISGPPAQNKKREVSIENPLLRSGILLAGAKRSLTIGSSGHYDGIVTAEKILGMNLRGTKLVVLSACDTGLGEVKSGEGVFGLRRAFIEAGAKSLVMSLWKVPDRETEELMVQFYRNIKAGTLNRCQALKQAILTEKKIVLERYGNDNPRYWGAFVFMGQP